MEFPHVLTLSSLIKKWIDMMIMWWKSSSHLWPMIFNIRCFIIVLWRLLLISDRILLYFILLLLPLITRGGLIGFWKYLNDGVIPLKQYLNILIIMCWSYGTGYLKIIIINRQIINLKIISILFDVWYLIFNIIMCQQIYL